MPLNFVTFSACKLFALRMFEMFGVFGFVVVAVDAVVVGVRIVADVIGLVAGKKFGEKFDKPRCPKCGVKFDIREGFPKE